MPEVNFTKPWHGIPREEIDWHPSIDEDACIGCGTCVTGCSRKVYRFDFLHKKAVVADPLNCMVACMTCANTCPTSAISFPPVRSILELADLVEVHHSVEDELLARRDELTATTELPGPDLIVELVVCNIDQIGAGTRILTLTPRRDRDRLCQFAPGQYLELWVPNASWLSRAYSIANAPRPDDSLELQIRKVQGGRLSTWAFGPVAVGDVVAARGPLGSFTMRSPGGRPVVFVARGTGFAPIKALLEQQVEMFSDREMVLFWGVTSSEDFYRARPSLSAVRHRPEPVGHARRPAVRAGLFGPERCDDQNGAGVRCCRRQQPRSSRLRRLCGRSPHHRRRLHRRADRPRYRPLRCLRRLLWRLRTI